MINWLLLAEMSFKDHERSLQVLRNYEQAGRVEAFMKQIYVCLHKYHVTKYCSSRHQQQCIEKHIKLVEDLTRQTEELTRKLNTPN